MGDEASLDRNPVKPSVEDQQVQIHDDGATTTNIDSNSNGHVVTNNTESLSDQLEQVALHGSKPSEEAVQKSGGEAVASEQINNQESSSHRDTTNTHPAESPDDSKLTRMGSLAAEMDKGIEIADPAPDIVVPTIHSNQTEPSLPSQVDANEPSSTPVTESPAVQIAATDLKAATVEKIKAESPQETIDPTEVAKQAESIPDSSSIPAPPPTNLDSPSASSTAVDSPHPQYTRSSSVSSAGGISSTTSTVFIANALSSIASSKDGRRNKALKEATDKALELIKSGTADQNPEAVFEPLSLACKTRNMQLEITALDCIGKLISYNFFVASENSHQTENIRLLADRVTDTVCDCFVGEATDEKVQTQIIKALLGTVLSASMPVHQSALLKAVRTVYNIFLLSRNITNQTIAQGSLTQMVHVVFGRVKTDTPPARPSYTNGKTASRHRASVSVATLNSLNGDATATPPNEETIRENPEAENVADSTPAEAISVSHNDERSVPNGTEENAVQEAPEATASGKVTLQSFENRKSFDGAAEKSSLNEVSLEELHIKDAFLVFRALCKLSMKSIPADSTNDLKSHSMRSKLLSLQLVNGIINSHLAVFTSPHVALYSSSNNHSTPFIDASKQYLCLALSRNAVSPVKEVFEISCSMFYKIVIGMRDLLKKEIEVFFNEIFLPILEMKNSSAQLKVILLNTLLKICNEPQTLVEIYLNYDCDGTSMENVYERIMNIVSKLSQTGLTQAHQQLAQEQTHTPSPVTAERDEHFPPARSSSTSTVPTLPSEITLKQQSLQALLSVLKSLVAWANKGLTAAGNTDSSSSEPMADLPSVNVNVQSEDGPEGVLSPRLSSEATQSNGLGVHQSGMSSTHSFHSSSTAVASSNGVRAKDDPEQFETAKQRKTILWDGIRKFNAKPKRGMEVFLAHGYIPSPSPQDIAKFLLTTEGLNKAMLGEFLGEGDPENVAIMHAFVDQMHFGRMPFTDALRGFLQSFRLPGEAQKIDRFMLKFAEKYIDGNPTTFANADTAYVLAYSVIMLNTDLHNPVIKRRMTKDEFLRNNRGIDDGKDIDEGYLNTIYDEIATNEIKMKGEEDAHAAAAAEAAAAQASQGLASGIGNALATVGRDLQREAYVAKSEEMANKTEALFKSMLRAQRKGGVSAQFFSASHFEHVRPMFEVAWMPILAGISGPLQDSEDMDTILFCLEGFKNAIRIICLFDLELERNAFITTLAKFTFLNNLGEMKPKNVEAIKCLLDIAISEGNYLKGSWKEVLTCVSQLERFQLISRGVDQDTVPDISFGRRQTRESIDSGRPRQSVQVSRPKPPKGNTYDEEVAEESRSSQIVIATDRIFTSSANLSGTAIVDFVRSLSDVSWEEIQSSGLGDNVRLYSLQKLVEISYYNMGRIRMEWSNMWAILGDHFNQVGCGPNPHVAIFALDSLRQLAMRFLEKEELAHFKFQKEFLKPFEFILGHNPNGQIKDMVLRCLQQMIQARAINIKSGWRTMFGVFTKAAKESNETIVMFGFDIVKHLNAKHFNDIIANGAFADLIVCLTEYCKNNRFQKISLQSIELLKGTIEHMLHSPECPLSDEYTGADSNPEDAMIRFWYPVLFAFHDIIMTGEDLEVRTRALDYLYDSLRHYGKQFPKDFWDIACREILFPIFHVLRSRQDVSRFSTQEDMSVWLSTTMIQALRNLIDLFTFYFDILSLMLDGFLELLSACICQENDTLARIGTSCLQKLIEDNVDKLSPEHWGKIVTTFVQLFQTTTAHQLFDHRAKHSLDASAPNTPPDTPTTSLDAFMPHPTPTSTSKEPSSPNDAAAADRKREFKQIIVKCVLQLLLIETVHELLIKNDIYDAIPSEHMLSLMDVLEKSFRFARRFNNDKDLRVNLWRIGFMKQLPNLLKQESSSASTYVTILLKMYGDPHPDRQNAKDDIEKALIPLSLDILHGFNSFDAESQQRNITAWTPVVVELLDGYLSFEDEDFLKHMSTLYPHATGMLGRDLDPSVRIALKKVLERIGTVVFN